MHLKNICINTPIRMPEQTMKIEKKQQVKTLAAYLKSTKKNNTSIIYLTQFSNI